LLKPNVLANRG